MRIHLLGLGQGILTAWTNCILKDCIQFYDIL